MVIPSKQSQAQDIRKLRSQLKMPKEWSIKYTIEPNIETYDLGCSIDQKYKVIEIKCFMGRYPNSFEQYYKKLCDDINKKMGWDG
jgi:hypothetical protein